ncbi:mesoderm posterior protein 1 [Oryctolagus cuniculus]|uniref:mesoderm posterior protein 1 n=1 Tax=Oryctolagus cuniculus TaxID=9986 RepID=UPI003879FBF4
MAQPLCPALSEPWVLSSDWSPARPPPPPSDRACGRSPDSWGGSPEPRPPRPTAARPRGARGSRLGSGQRQSASEREKLRMRTLARALHELRRFLPPSVAPAGQSLTKIETLRLAIRYIGHLSAVLGLSEDSLRRPRRRRSDTASPRGWPLCPDGGAAQVPGVGSAVCTGAAWASPDARPRGRAYAEVVCPEGQAMEPSRSARLFPGDVLALLDAWTPPSSLEGPPA